MLRPAFLALVLAFVMPDPFESACAGLHSPSESNAATAGSLRIWQTETFHPGARAEGCRRTSVEKPTSASTREMVALWCRSEPRLSNRASGAMTTTNCAQQDVAHQLVHTSCSSLLLIGAAFFNAASRSLRKAAAVKTVD